MDLKLLLVNDEVEGDGMSLEGCGCIRGEMVKGFNPSNPWQVPFLQLAEIIEKYTPMPRRADGAVDVGVLRDMSQRLFDMTQALAR